MSKALHVKGINLLKSIGFGKYLDCIFAVSQIKEPELYKTNPKAALIKMICEHFTPLLQRIKKYAQGKIKQHGN